MNMDKDICAGIAEALPFFGSIPDDLFGELLRALTFTDSGFGCYSNFDLRDGFSAIASDCLDLDTRTRLIGCFANDPSEIERVQAYFHDDSGLLMCWHWDGDGTLLFKTPDFTLVNDDCKKSYGWEREKKAIGLMDIGLRKRLKPEGRKRKAVPFTKARFMRPETDMANQARKEEREAIVEWLAETQLVLNRKMAAGEIGRLVWKHYYESLGWTIEAINRGDHWEGKDGK